MIKSFKGVTALVTGASSGIGKALARELARQGANLVLVSRNRQKLRQEADDLKNRFGIGVWIFDADLARREDRERLFCYIEEQKITVDVLVNNAGIGQYGPFHAHSREEITNMLKLNVEALTALTHFFLPGMQNRKTGGIINVASTAGFQPLPYLSLYAATKAFVVNFTEALWVENLKHQVRIFCLCPGNTLTRFHQTAGIARQKMFLSASAEDVARFASRKFLKGWRPTGIFGTLNKLMIYAERLGPRIVVLFFTNLIYRSWEREN